MANISTAFGTFTLKGGWSPGNIETLNDISRIWSGWYYETSTSGMFETPGTAVPFTSSGRWCYESNLESLGDWTFDTIREHLEMPNKSYEYKETYFALKKRFENLLKDMSDNDLTIDISYSDEEGGVCYLMTQEGVLYSDGTRLAYSAGESKYYDYTTTNYYMLDFECGCLEELICDLCERAGIDRDDHESSRPIEYWAMLNSAPHDNCYDYLNDAKKKLFDIRFCGKTQKAS